MQKYWQLFHISWESGFVYRLNFVMWRLRMVLQLLAVYFLWNAVLSARENAFGYSAGQLLTYIMGVSLIRSLVFASRSMDVQGDIGSGNLNNYLIKPFNFFGYWLSRDWADKLLNFIFAVGEITLLYFLIRPPVVGPASFTMLIFSSVAVLLAVILYFYFSICISFSTFWMPEGNGWPQRFFIFTLLEFFAGGLFPLDILPASVFAVVKFLPTTYFLNTPMQIYLGRMTISEIWFALGMMVFWLVTFKLLAQRMFSRGLKIYGAYGR